MQDEDLLTRGLSQTSEGMEWPKDANFRGLEGIPLNQCDLSTLQLIDVEGIKWQRPLCDFADILYGSVVTVSSTFANPSRYHCQLYLHQVVYQHRMNANHFDKTCVFSLRPKLILVHEVNAEITDEPPHHQ